MITTSVTLAGVRFKNRVLVASGTYGYGDDTIELVDVAQLGGIVTKSLSMKPRDGNPPPRIVETASGMLNSIGLANIGVHRFIAEKLPFLRTLDTAIIANIAASSIDEYCNVLDALEAEEGIDGYEINVSCPNVKEGGLSFGTNPMMIEEITRRLRSRTRKFLSIKLTPNVTHISEFARAAESAGADALSVINTLIGMAVNIHTRKPKLSTVTGGLSGPAIKPVALAKVYEASKAVKIPVIGIGGIMNADDAIEFLMVGASAVQVGTANYIDPGAGIKIAEGIRVFCESHNLSDVGDLVGSLDAKTEFSAISSWL
ncbi:MAG: dihydroorotate dehydrogenase [Bacteroidetes bacterium]|nr:dihydroorotate dehydrogenase [Bacteroidota bacterium]MCW5896266.1 dihydroorotate dehydrogenase [Bacteroidota bacterium]